MARQNILITGASAGIGAATARLAAELGYDVGIGYRSDKIGAERVAAEVEERGGKAMILQGDVAKPEDVKRIFTEFDTFGRLNSLVNNAGIVMPTSRVEDISYDRLRQIFDVNVIGSFLCAQEAISRLSKRAGGRGGTIINLSSAAARLGSPDMFVDYAATKGAIDSFTTGLALEQSSEGVRVNAVRPGVIDTEIHAKGQDPDRIERVGHTLPMKRAGTAGEVAEAIMWLASDQSSYVTGATIDVTGGR